MKILTIETSTKHLSIAIGNENSIMASYVGEEILRHSQDAIPVIEKLLKKTNLDLQDLNAFAISIGPGSFTGLRVGAAILKGLALATNIPIIAVPTLDAIAQNAVGGSCDICVIVDARKNNLYTSLYKKDKESVIIRKWDYLLLSVPELIEKLKDPGKILFIGDGIKPYKNPIKEKIKQADFAGEKDWFPDIKATTRLAVEKFKKKEFTDPDTLVPMYMYSRECNVRGIGK